MNRLLLFFILFLSPLSASAYSVVLTWSPPVSADPVVGYAVYRAIKGSSSYVQIAANVTTATYTDSGVSIGTTYVYYVVSLDAQGVQSIPSNLFTAVIPTINPATSVTVKPT